MNLSRRQAVADAPATAARSRRSMPHHVSLQIARCLTVIVTTLASACSGHDPISTITLVGAKTSFMWPMYIAREAGYYEQNGIKVELLFANHPAGVAMLVAGDAQVNANTLQQAMQLVAKDRSFTLVGSPLAKFHFALVARKDVSTVRELRGKRIGVTQIGGSTYDYAVALLRGAGLKPDDVAWVVLGDSSRGAALEADVVDATMLNAPAYFKLERAGYPIVANVANTKDIHTPNVLIFRNETLAAFHSLREALVKAHVLAVRRFYADKQFAIRAYLKYDRQDPHDLEDAYELLATEEAFVAAPYLTRDAVESIVYNQPDPRISEAMRKVDYHKVIDNDVLDRVMASDVVKQLVEPAAQRRPAGVITPIH